MVDHVEVIYSNGNKNMIFDYYDWIESDFTSLYDWYGASIYKFIRDNELYYEDKVTVEFITGSFQDEVYSYSIFTSILQDFYNHGIDCENIFEIKIV